jgi:hypothetical protein
MLKDLKEPVLIQCYFSTDLPASIKAELDQIRTCLMSIGFMAVEKSELK